MLLSSQPNTAWTTTNGNLPLGDSTKLSSFAISCVAAWKASRDARLRELLSRAPELLRRKDVCQLTGWSKRTYYRVVGQYLVSLPGYLEEKRLPKSVLIVLLTSS